MPTSRRLLNVHINNKMSVIIQHDGIWISNDVDVSDIF